MDLVATWLQRDYRESLRPRLHPEGFAVWGQRDLIGFAAQIQNGTEGTRLALELIAVELARAIGIHQEVVPLTEIP